MRDGSKSCVQGVQALVGHMYIYMHSTPAAPSTVLHTPPLCASCAISYILTHALGMVAASHAAIGCVCGTSLAALAHVGCWESIPRDVPANPGVSCTHTLAPLPAQESPESPLGPGCRRDVMLEVILEVCGGAQEKEGGISSFPVTPRCFCSSLQLPGWKPVHSGPRAALYLQVSAACVSSQEQEALLKLAGEDRGCLHGV